MKETKATIVKSIWISDIGALRDQTAFNIRERGGSRKQKPLRRPEIVGFVTESVTGGLGYLGGKKGRWVRTSRFRMNLMKRSPSRKTPNPKDQCIKIAKAIGTATFATNTRMTIPRALPGDSPLNCAEIQMM